MSINVDTIVRMAKRGRLLFPCKPGAKLPAVSWRRWANSDEDTLRAYWSRYPHSNVGLVTGKGSQVFVIDLDKKKDVDGLASLTAIEKEIGELPRTLRLRTPGQGFHLYFEWDDRLLPATIRAGALGPGIDWRGEGGYVLAPPSIINGKTYDVVDNVPIAKLPDVWIERILTAASAGKAPAPKKPKPPSGGGGGDFGFDDDEDASDESPDVGEGGRNDFLLRVAGRLRRRGASSEDIEAALQRVNTNKCNPPLGRNEVATIARSVARYPVGPPPLNDTGNARRFAMTYMGEVVFVRERDEWLKWGGKRWVVMANTEAIEMSRKLVEQLAIEAAELTDSEQRESASKWAHACGESRRLRAMAELAKGADGISASAVEFDSNWHMLAATEHTLTLNDDGTIKREPHAPTDRITKMVAASGEQGIYCPVWQAFLERMQPDPEVRAYLQRAAAYTLVGGQDEKCAFVIYGPSNSGKSVFIETISAAMGDYTCAGDVSMFATPADGGNTPRLAAAQGARLVSCPEIPQTRTFEADVFKRWTGGDTVSAMAKNKPPVTFAPEGKVWFAGNHPPRVETEDDATWGRIKIIPFKVEIPAAERDSKLRQRISLDGVFAWMLDGWADYCERGLAVPASCQRATEEARTESDRLSDAMAELAVIEAGALCTANHLRVAYLERARTLGERPISQRAMGDILTGRYGLERVRSKHGWLWRGVRLSEVAMAYAGAGAEAPLEADGIL